jgi:hypothetical protein
MEKFFTSGIFKFPIFSIIALKNKRVGKYGDCPIGFIHGYLNDTEYAIRMEHETGGIGGRGRSSENKTYAKQNIENNFRRIY